MLLVHPSLTLPAALILGISRIQGHVLSAAFTTSYVGSIYIAQLLLNSSLRTEPARAKNKTSTPAIAPITATDIDTNIVPGPARGARDHPETIKIRIKAASLATIGTMLGVWYVVKNTGRYSLAESVSLSHIWRVVVNLTGQIRPTFALLGIPSTLSIPSLSFVTVLPYILAPTLLLGPLYAYYLDSDLPLQSPSPDSIPTRIYKSLTNIPLTSLRNYIIVSSS
jgi:prenyl protein peptidase